MALYLHLCLFPIIQAWYNKESGMLCKNTFLKRLGCGHVYSCSWVALLSHVTFQKKDIWCKKRQGGRQKRISLYLLNFTSFYRLNKSIALMQSSNTISLTWWTINTISPKVWYIDCWEICVSCRIALDISCGLSHPSK